MYCFDGLDYLVQLYYWGVVQTAQDVDLSLDALHLVTGKIFFIVDFDGYFPLLSKIYTTFH